MQHVEAARSSVELLQAKLARVFEVCEQQWEVYNPLCEEYDLLLAYLRCWQDRARHKQEKRHQTQQHNCADTFRHMPCMPCTTHCAWHNLHASVVVPNLMMCTVD